MTHSVKNVLIDFLWQRNQPENGWDYFKKVKFSTEKEYRLVFMGFHHTQNYIVI